MEKPTITIEEIDYKIIYVRFKGDYVSFRRNSRKLFNELFEFATKHNLIIPEVTKVLTIYNDNPFITKGDNLRTSVAMTVPVDAKIIEDGNICTTLINGKFGIGHFNISTKDYGNAWDYMYKEWLFIGEEKPRDVAPFELYVEEPSKNSKEKRMLDIYIPIE